MLNKITLFISNALVFGYIFSLAACAKVPISGRESLQFMPDSELTSYAVKQYDDTLKKSKLSQDKADVAMVRKVGIKIAHAAEKFLKETGRLEQAKSFNWEFNLIEDKKTANAWVLPGGKAAVYSGILKYTQNETGLAVVLGHEVGHAVANHGNERMSQNMLAQLGQTAMALAFSEKSSQTQKLFMAAFGAGLNVGVLLPYSRLQESEADRIGLSLMAMAGYDPRKAVTFWQNMSHADRSRPLELLSTHPAPAARIANIKHYLPEALKYYKG
jgi:predicted Zn-dependent protease